MGHQHSHHKGQGHHQHKQTIIQGHFTPNVNDPFACKYSKNGNILRKVQDDSSWQAITGRQLQHNAITSYKIRQSNIIDGRIIYGIGTAAIKGQNEAFSSSEFIGYYAHNGHFWAEGKCINSNGGVIKNGDVVEVKIDLINGKVEWFRNGGKIAEYFLPAGLQPKAVYQAIFLINTNSEIEIL